MAQKDGSLEAGLNLCEKLATLQSFVIKTVHFFAGKCHFLSQKAGWLRRLAFCREKLGFAIWKAYCFSVMEPLGFSGELFPETAKLRSEDMIPDTKRLHVLDSEDTDDSCSEGSGSAEGSESAVEGDRSKSQSLDDLNTENNYYSDSASEESVNGSTESLPITATGTQNPDACTPKEENVHDR